MNRRRRENGAAAVEFALIAPLFIALVFGIISYGYMLSFRQGISQAAVEGARVYAVAPSGSPTLKTDALAAVNRSLSPYGIACTSTGTLKKGAQNVGTCTVPTAAVTCTNNAATKCATVRIQYSYRSHPLVPTFPGLGITLPESLSFDSTVQVNS